MLKFNFRIDINRAFARTKIAMDVLLLYKFPVCVKLMRVWLQKWFYSLFRVPVKMFSIHSCYFWKLLRILNYPKNAYFVWCSLFYEINSHLNLWDWSWDGLHPYSNTCYSIECSEWRTQEFCLLGGGSTNTVEDRENGDLGAVAP